VSITSAGRVFAVGLPGLMGSQPLGAGQAQGGGGMVCIESFAYDSGDGRTTIVSAGDHVAYGDPVLAVASQRFVDSGTVQGRPVLLG
jgi:hypothetical protein